VDTLALNTRAMSPDQLKAARQRLGYTQRQMASELRLGENGARTVRRWELAEREIPGPVEALIETWLGFPVTDL
jgi:DNA-binding transcriptional regulator YiaG